jgi:putative acetyltransferase
MCKASHPFFMHLVNHKFVKLFAMEIVEYSSAHAPAFRRLNQEWIEKYFVMEEPDYISLNDPEEYILKPGGHIFFAVENEEVLGTVALIKEHDGFELAKMAVTPVAQGRGIGKLLGEAAIAKARELGARHLMLISNRKLIPAITLYEKLGFKEVPLDKDNPYLRGDIKMLITF